MTFILQNRILDNSGDITWVEPGVYDFVRMFDSNRALIDVAHDPLSSRQLTVVKLTDGLLTD